MTNRLISLTYGADKRPANNLWPSGDLERVQKGVPHYRDECLQTLLSTPCATTLLDADVADVDAASGFCGGSSKSPKSRAVKNR